VSWSETRVAELLGVRYPIVQAPMAGGFTTPELVAAVSNAGALGSVAGAMLAPDVIREQIRAVRELTDRPFAVNIFAPIDIGPFEPAAVDAMQRELGRYREELGLGEPGELRLPPPGLVDAQLEVIADERPPVFSFTFGIPDLRRVREAGCAILGSATTVPEAVALERAGVDAVVAQAYEAGGHRGTFLGPFERGLVGGVALVPQIVDRVEVPVVLAGGIMDGRGVAGALALGAEGAQLGTAFLSAEEAGTPEAYARLVREATEESTTITRAYTGRHARAIRTRLIEHLETADAEVLPYPVQGAALMDVRQAATEQGVGDLLFLLAGQASGLSRRLPASELVESLVRETQTALARLVP
jgi:nitronate monooxygenase